MLLVFMCDLNPNFQTFLVMFVFDILLILQPTLGVNKSSSALLYVVLSPVGPYFKTGTFSPVALLADPSFVRAWPGGCGDSKMGGYVDMAA